mmetsp:Transcript_4046/g.7914  ORF Transcript_4046/g.7914 Transcript_4046/m.7914 type:complete len:266 (+) Transcript_4046:1287-2084(+)
MLPPKLLELLRMRSSNMITLTAVCFSLLLTLAFVGQAIGFASGSFLSKVVLKEFDLLSGASQFTLQRCHLLFKLLNPRSQLLDFPLQTRNLCFKSQNLLLRKAKLPLQLCNVSGQAAILCLKVRHLLLQRSVVLCERVVPGCLLRQERCQAVLVAHLRGQLLFEVLDLVLQRRLHAIGYSLLVADISLQQIDLAVHPQKLSPQNVDLRCVRGHCVCQGLLRLRQFSLNGLLVRLERFHLLLQHCNLDPICVELNATRRDQPLLLP